MLKTYKIVDSKIALDDNGAGNIMVFNNPDEAEKKFLVEEYKLDEHTLSSSLDADELARIEFEPDHLAMIFKIPKIILLKNRFSSELIQWARFYLRKNWSLCSMTIFSCFMESILTRY